MAWLRTVRSTPSAMGKGDEERLKIGLRLWRGVCSRWTGRWCGASGRTGPGGEHDVGQATGGPLELLHHGALLLVIQVGALNPAGQELLGSAAPAPVEVLHIHLNEGRPFGLLMLYLVPDTSRCSIEQERASRVSGHDDELEAPSRLGW